MSYKVIGAAAVVELDDGNPDPGTGRRVYLEQNANFHGRAFSGCHEPACAPSR
jgi:hypothetical protein